MILDKMLRIGKSRGRKFMCGLPEAGCWAEWGGMSFLFEKIGYIPVLNDGDYCTI